MRYAELHCKSNFSFLTGASHPDELVGRAAELGYAALALTDRDSLSGVVRGWGAARDGSLPMIVGAEVHLSDAPPVVLWAQNRDGYGRLCRLLSRGRMRCEKGACLLHWDDLAELNEGLLAGLLPRFATVAAGGRRAALGRFADLFGDRGYLLASLCRGVDDAAWLDDLQRLGRSAGVPLVAAGDVHYHRAERMVLYDAVTAIRQGTTIDAVRSGRHANSQRHLRSLGELERLYCDAPELLARTGEIADRCRFRLDELRYEYPRELAPEGQTPIEHLKRLAWEGAQQRWPEGVPEGVLGRLRYELRLIEQLRYEAYFLTVWDLVRFARSRGILCQGRGSAANSTVCYCLGVTSVDPDQLDLLFERFISRERNEAPDIDVDFEHERREEVLQYIYTKYGRERAGLTATVISYRARSAVRDVGKALGMSADRIDSLAKRSDSYGGGDPLADRCRSAGLDPESEIGQRFVYLVENLIGFPRHLSQHVGGMVITQGPLCELCPIENAAMEGRTVIQWDKDDLDELGILKVDCLALGMLTALHRGFDLIADYHGRQFSLATLPPEDAAVYEMICQADTVGVFQIESRAQMSMLPRLRPRCYYDLVIEVAIVRPGPIQGEMVHPYLQARRDGAVVEYPNEAIRRVLEKTLGVPIFQEQAMRLAVVAAGFTPGEADQLRRAMAAWRRPGVIDRFRQKLLQGMRAHGLSAAFAEHVFRQIRGFGEYGFPESHAASFALLVYASAYLKCHYPAAFCAALLNSQPMGFYAPAQLVSDARRHGVTVLPADVNRSAWDCTLEPDPGTRSGEETLPPRPAVRLGLRMVRGISAAAAERVVAQRRRGGPYRAVADLARRAALGQGMLAVLAEADALGTLAGDRRAALWESLAQERGRGGPLPLLEGAEAGQGETARPSGVEPMTPLEEVVADYHTTGLSLRGHPIGFYREQLRRRGCVTAEQLAELRSGRQVRVAGLVLLRQRPGTAKGITFVTLEDETGSINLVIHPPVWQRHGAIVRTSHAWRVAGRLENRQGVIHVIAGRIDDLTELVGPLRLRSRDFQ